MEVQHHRKYTTIINMCVQTKCETLFDKLTKIVSARVHKNWRQTFGETIKGRRSNINPLARPWLIVCRVKVWRKQEEFKAIGKLQPLNFKANCRHTFSLWFLIIYCIIDVCKKIGRDTRPLINQLRLLIKPICNKLCPHIYLPKHWESFRVLFSQKILYTMLGNDLSTNRAAIVSLYVGQKSCNLSRCCSTTNLFI